MREFYDFVQRAGLGVVLFLEREAGYHLVSLFLIVLGIFLADAANRAQLARDLVTFGLGVLARGMGSAAKAGTVMPGKPGA